VQRSELKAETILALAIDKIKTLKKANFKKG